MKQITAQEAIALLRKSSVLSARGLDELNFSVNNQKFLAAYWNDDAVVYVIQYEAPSITIVPQQENADFESIAAFIRRSYPEAESLSIDMQLLSEMQRQHVREVFFPNFTPWKRMITDYAYTAKDAPKEQDSASIRLLTLADQAKFVEIPQPQTDNRPPLAVLFHVFVENKEGCILGFFDGDVLVGYLSYSEYVKGFFDVDYIYVIPECRNRGVGRQLARSYVRHALAADCLPYYSNAQNDFSARTAQGAGFVKSCEILHFNKIVKTKGS